MPNVYKRKTDRGIQDYDALVKAIKEIMIDKRSIRSVAAAYNIVPASLNRYVTKIRGSGCDVASMSDDVLKSLARNVASYKNTNVVFKPDEENDFYDYMKNNTFHYYGLTITEFRKHAYDFARKINARYPPTWDENELAGIDWYYCFMKRNPHMAELMEGEAARKAAAKANGEQSTTPEAKGSKRRTETTEEKDYHC